MPEPVLQVYRVQVLQAQGPHREPEVRQVPELHLPEVHRVRQVHSEKSVPLWYQAS